MFQSKPEVRGGLLWIGGVHGDEPEGVELATQTLQWLLNTKTPITWEWSLIPCLNPDGVVLKQRTNGNGVDLNRNYPSKDWSPAARKNRYHPGPEAGSEPENRALTKLIEVQKPKLIVHCHSWKPCIVCSGQPGMKYANWLAEASGYELKEEIGYETPGSLSSYAWKDHGIPVICIEEKDHEDLNLVWPRFSHGVKKIFIEGN